MNSKQNYLKQAQNIKLKGKYDYNVSSNFDERYREVFPQLSPKQFVVLANRYPNYANCKTAEKIKQKFGLKNIILGAGSEDLIIKCNKIIRSKGWKTGVILPTFYRITETLKEWQPITKDKFLGNELNDMDIIWVCNPNPLDGQIIEKNILLNIFKKNKKIIFLIDETTIFFLDNWQGFSFLGQTPKNVLVINSFSKLFGLSGLRAGFASGNLNLLHLLQQEGTTFPFTSITESFVESILKNDRFFENIRIEIKKNKNEVEQILKQNTAIEIKPSETNCIFCRYKKNQSLYRDLLKKGIISLNLDQQFGIPRQGWVQLTAHSSKKLHKILIAKIKFLNREGKNETKN